MANKLKFKLVNEQMGVFLLPCHLPSLFIAFVGRKKFSRLAVEYNFIDCLFSFRFYKFGFIYSKSSVYHILRASPNLSVSLLRETNRELTHLYKGWLWYTLSEISFNRRFSVLYFSSVQQLLGKGAPVTLIWTFYSIKKIFP